MITAAELRAAVPGFADVDADTLTRIARAAIDRRFSPRQALYRAGDPADGLYIVLSGKVHVTRETPARTQMLHSESAGGVLGEIPVFGGGAFPATAVATEGVRCAHLPIAAVERLLREEPAFARFALRRLAVRAQSLLRRIDELTATTVTSRLAAYVVARIETTGDKDFTLGMSQEALAAELGTAREVVVRGLAALVDAGAIARTGRSRFSVKQVTVLRSIAGTG